MAFEIFPPLYLREIKEPEFGLALEESIGHLNFLWHKGIISREIKEGG